MRVNTKVPLSMIDDHHLAIAREALRERYSALLYCSNFLADGCFNINAFSKDFGCKLGMLGFAKTTCYLSSNGPLESAPHRIKPSAGGKFWRLSSAPAGHLLNHLLETQCGLL